jgi:predicted flap endonuclease-1-like 5' DNA nuclease
MEEESSAETPRPTHMGLAPTNEETAQLLDEAAGLLEAQNANPFRVTAYRRAASAVRALPVPVAEAAAGGPDALMAALGIGPRLARTIAEIIATGRLGLLDRLRGETEPKVLLATVAGIGPELAERIHQELGVETLEELEMAAHDGRLATVRGFASRRVRGVTDALAGRLGRRGRRPLPPLAPSAPPVAELLDVDRQYREEAAADRLRRIAPRRFNPGGRAWLPILHTERGDRHYTALFSNTARAHELGRTGDWVVIYLDDGGSERQATVVTETHGPLAGQRVVRGRERECAAHYAAPAPNGRSVDGSNANPIRAADAS